MDRFERRLTDTHAHVLTLEVLGRPEVTAAMTAGSTAEETLEVDVAFEYTACDPWAVSLLFLAGTGAIRWTMARDLLADGLLEHAGIGDVHAWPGLDRRGRAALVVELRGREGQVVLLQASARDVSRFLDASYDVVARGAEADVVDLEAGLEALVTSAPQRG